MSEQVYVYPREGLTPRLSNGNVCGPDGAWSLKDRHLRHLLRDKDVTIGDPPVAQAAKSASASKKGGKS